jgi:hypothetical protein
MKHLLIFCLFVLNPLITYTQETLSIDFSNGETKEITIDYDDPTNLPKMGVDIKFFGLMFFHSEALSFKLSPYYRINEKWMINQILQCPMQNLLMLILTTEINQNLPNSLMIGV